jgi:hypothetical protein
MRRRLEKKINSRGQDSHTRFILAALKGNFSTMRKLLGKGHNINSASEEGETAFSWCCQYNKLRSAQFLYKNGADVNSQLAKKATPLDVAVCWSSPTFRIWLKSVGGIRKQKFKEWDWNPKKKLRY